MSQSRHTGTVISVHIATHAQIAEPLFCNFHNEAFGIIIKLRERKEAPWGSSGLCCWLLGPALQDHTEKNSWARGGRALAELSSHAGLLRPYSNRQRGRVAAETCKSLHAIPIP